MEAMKTCPDCGERVYSLGCTWCNEEAYIQEQERLTWLLDEPPAVDAVARSVTDQIEPTPRASKDLS